MHASTNRGGTHARRLITRTACVMLWAALLTPAVAGASDYHWNGSANDNVWTNRNNWQLGFGPAKDGYPNGPGD